MSGFIRIKRNTFRIGTILLYAFFLSLIAYAFVPQILTQPKPGEKSLRCQAATLYVGLARAAGENCTTKCTDWAPADCDGFSACYNKNISCTNGIDQDGRPCQGCCFDCTVECEPIDEPPSISGSISCGQWGKNGWCIDSASLDLNVSDPQGYSLRITGNAAGTSISCDGDCSIALPSGSGSANYEVTAADSGMSDSGSASWNYDPDSPNLGLNINGSTGKNGWYRSQVTVTPTGSDSISGLAGTFVSVNGGSWQPSATLDDGEHTIDFTAADRAGNVVNSSTSISVDTTTPTMSVRVSGKSGNGGWYISDVSISATASDATSGVASLEVSVDGGSYHSYSSAVKFSEGHHTVQFRATDRAGNSTESAGQNIQIDKSSPTASLIAIELSDGTIAYKAHDGESGMSSIYLTIEDKAGLYPKIKWSDSISGKNVTGEYNWNGMLQDGTSAPPGEYTVWIKAVDRAGHVTTQTGTIVISEGGSLLTPSEVTSVSSEATPETEELNVEDSTEDVTFGGVTTALTEIENQSFSISGSASTGAKNSFPWYLVAGAATIAAGATATKVIAKPKKKKTSPTTENDPTEDRRAQLRADRQAERDAKAQAKKQKTYQKTARTEAQDDVKWQKTITARQKAADEAKKNQLSKKTQKMEAKEDAKWKKTVEAPKLAQLNAGLAAYYEARKEGEKETTPKPNWWEQTKSFIDEKVIQPVNTYIVEPILEPAAKIAKEVISAGIKWADETIYQPYLESKVDTAMAKLKSNISWVNEKIIQPWVIPFAKEVGGVISDGMELLNNYVIEPYVAPFISKVVERVMENAATFNENIFQPHILPALQKFNENIYQPYLAPIVDVAVDAITKSTELITERIYEPIFAPVVNDINEHIVKPFVDPAVAWLDKTWDEYGELVHNALDAVGFIPGLGDIADAVNGLVYLGEGKYLEAGISLLAMIPVLGDLGKAGKLSLKMGTELVEEAGEKFVKEAVEIGLEKGAKETTEAAAEKVAQATTETAIEKTTKEVTEVGAEKVAKETTEEFAEKAAKETTSEVAEKTAQKTVENTSSKALAESVENTAEKTAQKTANNVLEKSAKETGKAITSGSTEKAAKEAKEKLVEQALEKVDDKTAALVRSVADKVGDNAASIEKAVTLIQKHGDDAVKALKTVNSEAAAKVLSTVDDNILDDVVKQGSDAFAAFSGWAEKELKDHGKDLAARATKDAEVLNDVKTLVSKGPIDPKNLTTEQKLLIEKIAANSTFICDGKQIVVGKWVGLDGGFLKRARETGSLHYSPHPDLWGLFKGLDNQNEAAWLINQKVIQNGVSKGLPFEYTLDGIPELVVDNERDALEAIFSGKPSDDEIMQLLKSDYIPVRIRELQELSQSGYKIDFNDASQSYILSLKKGIIE